MKSYLVFGEDGVIKEKVFYEIGDPNLPRTPLIEMDYPEKEPEVFFAGIAGIDDMDEEDILADLEKAYKKWGKFGSYGDVMQIMRIECGVYIKYIITSIGHRAWPKPVMAADILPFFIDPKGKIFFACIKRKYGKKMGMPALIGGHWDVEGCHAQTAAEALVHEAKDEAGIIFAACDYDEDKLANFPDAPSIDVMIEAPVKVKTSLEFIRTFRTSSDEEEAGATRKRVDFTTAYLMVVPVEQLLSKEILKSWLKAGDDAAEIVVVEVGIDEDPGLAWDHHSEIYAEAKKRILAKVA